MAEVVELIKDQITPQLIKKFRGKAQPGRSVNVRSTRTCGTKHIIERNCYVMKNRKKESTCSSACPCRRRSTASTVTLELTCGQLTQLIEALNALRSDWRTNHSGRPADLMNDGDYIEIVMLSNILNDARANLTSGAW